MVDATAVQQATGAEIAESTFRDNRRWVVAAERLFAVLKELRESDAGSSRTHNGSLTCGRNSCKLAKAKSRRNRPSGFSRYAA